MMDVPYVKSTIAPGVVHNELLEAAERVWDASREADNEDTDVQSLWLRNSKIIVTIRRELPQAVERALVSAEDQIRGAVQAARN